MRVWVTRDEETDGPLSTALRAAGLTVVHEPVLTRRVVDDAAETISQLGPDDWLVLTSVYAVETVAVEPARVPRVAVVSEPSRRAAEARGFRVELVSAGGDGKSLFHELRQRATRGKVCYPRSSLARPPEPWPGVELISRILYETAPRDFDRGVIRRVDVVTVTSPSAVDAIQSATRSQDRPVGRGKGAVPGEGRDHIRDTAEDDPAGVAEDDFSLTLRGLPFASIGPTTSAELRRIGIEPWLEAPQRSFRSLAQAIAAKSQSQG